jgi:hypothetical protein
MMNETFFKKRIFTVNAVNGYTMNISTTDIDANGLITTIPPGYMLEFLVFSETSTAPGTAVTINIGTTAGDDDILSAYAIGANELITMSIGTIFSMTATQQIYVSSSAWTTAILDIYILLRKI